LVRLCLWRPKRTKLSTGKLLGASFCYVAVREKRRTAERKEIRKQQEG
jgi:hypothetical protein